MTVQSIESPFHGRQLKLGRRHPVAKAPSLRLRNYLLRAMPPHPATSDYSAPAKPSLDDVYLNDDLGDCVIAGGAHVRGVTSGGAGHLVRFTPEQIVRMYSAIGGYDPSAPLVDGKNPTDDGCNEQVALNYWTSVGFPDGVKLTGWLELDGTDADNVKAAIWLFENAFFALDLPNAWIHPFTGPGFTWDVAGAPVRKNGHCVVAVGYDDRGPVVDSWGVLGHITWSAVARYAVDEAGGALYALLSPDMIAKAYGKAPNGFDWTQLLADFEALGGHVGDMLGLRKAG